MDHSIYTTPDKSYVISDDDKDEILDQIKKEFSIRYKKYYDPSTEERRIKFKGSNSTIYKPMHLWKKLWTSNPPLNCVLFLLKDLYGIELEGSDTDKLCHSIHQKHTENPHVGIDSNSNNNKSNEKTIYVVFYRHEFKPCDCEVMWAFNSKDRAIDYLLSYLCDDHAFGCNEDDCYDCDYYNDERKNLMNDEYDSSSEYIISEVSLR